jgi:predicted DCC family thiol-disulfide oxidoreductase YuxK
VKTVPVVQFAIAGQEATRGLGRPYTVVYDGTCKVCTRLAGVLRAWDRNEDLEVVPSQATGVTARFPWIPLKAYAEALQLVGPGGRTWQGAAAIEQLLDILPKGKLIGWLFKLPFARTLIDRLYKWFARNRYKLGCGEHCLSRPANVVFREE